MAIHTFDYAFQKDVYVIINGFYEEQIKIPPSKTYWTAGKFVADAHAKYTNLPNSYIDYIPEIDCVIDKSYHICSSEGVSVIGQLYDWLKTHTGFNGTSYPEGISEDAIPFVLDLNRYYNNSIERNIVRRKEIVVSTNPANSNFEIKLPFYERSRLLFIKGNSIEETLESASYSNQPFTNYSLQTLRNEFKINKNSYINNRPKDGTFDYFQIQNDKYVFTDAVSLGLGGHFYKSKNKGIDFYLLPSVYTPPYKEEINQNTISEIIGLIYTDTFVYILHGQNNYIKLIQIYQRIPNFQDYIEIQGVKYYKNFDLTNGEFEYIGTIVCPSPNGAIGLSVKYIYPYYIYVEFHDHLFGTDYNEDLIKKYFNTRDDYESSYLRTSLNIRGLTNRHSFALNDRSNVVKIKYPMANNQNQIMVDLSNNIKIYLNSFYSYVYYVGSPVYSREQLIISGDKFTSILYDSNLYISPNLGFIEQYSPYSVGNILSFENTIKKRVFSKWEPLNLNSPQTILNEDLDYVNNNDTTDIPSQTKLPVYRFVFKIKWNLQYSNMPFSFRVSTIPVPFYSAEVTQPGLVLPGWLRTPAKIVIPPHKIVRVSITRGSVFDEHATAVIWNENGEYDILKNLVEYNVLICADYTKEYLLTNKQILTFQNNISAQELGVPQNCIVLFRGYSDGETPLSYQVLKASGGGLSRQENITLNIHSLFYKIKQAVPLVAESFNSYTHVQAIKDIFYRCGFNVDTDLIVDETHEDADMVLMPPIPQFNSGWTLEPPNNYGDFIRKICNEFSGWWLYYRHLNGKFYYHPRNFLVYPSEPKTSLIIHKKASDFANDYIANPDWSLLATDIEVKVQRPIATQIVLYGGTVYPFVKTDYVAINRKAVEDIKYEFYVGRNKTVFVYSPITEPKTLELILRNLSYRMLIGHKIANVKFYGWMGLGTYNICYLHGLGDAGSYGIVKSSSVDYDGNTKYIQGDAEIELVNYVANDGREYAIFWDDL